MKTRHMLIMASMMRRANRKPSTAMKIVDTIAMFLLACVVIVCGVIVGWPVLVVIGVVTLIGVGIQIACRIRKNRYRW